MLPIRPTATAPPIRSKFKATSISATAPYFTRIAALRCLRSSPIPAVATTRFTAAAVKPTIFCGTEYAIHQAVTRTSARSWLGSNWTNARWSVISTSSCRCRSPGRERRGRRRDLATRQLCRVARRARCARHPVQLSANAQPVQWLQPDTDPGGDLQAPCGAGERVSGLTMLVRPTAGP